MALDFRSPRRWKFNSRPSRLWCRVVSLLNSHILTKYEEIDLNLKYFHYPANEIYVNWGASSDSKEPILPVKFADWQNVMAMEYEIVKIKVKLSLCFFNWALRHEGVLGEWRCRSTHYWPRHQMEVSGQIHAPALFSQGKEHPVRIG
jgi:hypothetical protein